MGGPQQTLGLAVCPAATRITQEWGCTDYGGEWLASWCEGGHYHCGVDLGADGIGGAPVYATRHALVVAMEDPAHVIRLCPEMGGGLISAPYLGWEAVCLRLEDGVYLEYGHLRESYVQPGEVVTPGRLLGLVGTHGASCGDHLHLEARGDGPYQSCYAGAPILDPTPYLRFEAEEDEDMQPIVATAQGRGIFLVEQALKLPDGSWFPVGPKRHIPDDPSSGVAQRYLPLTTVDTFLLDRCLEVEPWTTATMPKFDPTALGSLQVEIEALIAEAPQGSSPSAIATAVIEELRRHLAST